MAHLGLNACAGTDATLAVIPAGTGNDLARGAGVPGSVKEAVEALIRGKASRFDLSLLTNASGSRYVGAVVSSGYDARVNRATNDIRLRFGALSYGYIALRELASFDPLRYRLTIDGVQREVSAMMVAIANTGIFGGGIRIAPGYDLTDGLLDVTIVHPVSRLRLMTLFPRLRGQNFVQHPCLAYLPAQQVVVDGPGLHGMADGEPLGRPPLTCTAAPGALTIFAPGGRGD